MAIFKTAKDLGLVKMMTARYAGTCACCHTRIRAGKDEIGYSRETKLAFCRHCAACYDSRLPAEEQVSVKVATIIAAKSAPKAAPRNPDFGLGLNLSGCANCRALGHVCPACLHDEY